MSFQGTPALVLGGGHQTAWHAQPQVLARLGGKNVLQPQVKTALAAAPAVLESQWKAAGITLSVRGGRGLIAFDALARQQKPRPYKARGATRLALDVPDGEYIVEAIASTKHQGFTLKLVRLRMKGVAIAKLPTSKTKKPPSQTVSVTPALRAAFAKLRWVGAADGAASIIVPCKNVSAWRADWDASSKGVAEVVGKGDALVIGDPGPTAVHRIDDGVIILKRTIGSGPEVLAAALSVPEGDWKRSKQTLRLAADRLVVLDAGNPPPKKLPSGADVEAGVYTIDVHAGYATRVGRARVEVQLVRLRRRPQ